MKMPKIEFAAHPTVNAIALGWFSKESDKKSSSGFPVYNGERSREITQLEKLLSQSQHFFGKKNEFSCLRFYSLFERPNTILLGFGPSSQWSAEVARQAGAALYGAQKKERFKSVAIPIECLGSPDGKKSETSAEIAEAFFEGYWLGAYEFGELKKEDSSAFSPESLVIMNTKSTQIRDACARARIISQAVNFARQLGDMPGNLMTPSELARHAEKMASQHGLKSTVWGRTQIEREKMNLLLGVAKGSAEEPRFIILRHDGGKKNDPPVILVGKGITFDSGGISLKPAARMEDMKFDMMGAAAVLGTFKAVAELDLPLNIVGLVAAAENMPDGRAQKPGDVVRSLGGKTVEIVNTDAEGRLILADALEYAQTLNPQAIIDFATLTGAVLDALGTVASGIMGNHAGLLDRIKEAAEFTGERVWQLPLYDEYLDDLKSSIADIKNTGVREAGSSKGGTFLKFFVDKKFPWAHCDIAGTAYHRKDVPYHPSKLGSGVLVRLVTHLLSQWKPLR
jgi:leucyl aminopeptidase